jgi:hypothetical protein
MELWRLEDGERRDERKGGKNILERAQLLGVMPYSSPKGDECRALFRFCFSRKVIFDFFTII